VDAGSPERSATSAMSSNFMVDLKFT
jgi:hypothetical protein